MVDFGSSIKITGIVVSGMSISLVILLNSMTQLAYENDLSNNLTMTTLPAEKIMQSTEPTIVGGITKKQCKKFLMYFAKKLMKILNNCMRALKKEYPDKEEYSKRFDCTLRCVLKAIKILDDNSAMTNTTVDAFTQEWVPEKYRPLVHHFNMPCVDAWGGKLNDGDPYCKNYGRYVTCLQNAVADC